MTKNGYVAVQRTRIGFKLKAWNIQWLNCYYFTDDFCRNEIDRTEPTIAIGAQYKSGLVYLFVSHEQTVVPFYAMVNMQIEN